IQGYLNERLHTSVRAGGKPAVDGSVMKVLWAEARRERAEIGVALLGAGGALHAEWPFALLEQFAGTLGAGTTEVHPTSIGAGEFDVGHARGVLQHIAQGEAVVDTMIAAAKPGGWVVVTDVDWIQFDAQPVPDPFATLSSTLRSLSTSQHGYDGSWGRLLLDAFTRHGLLDVDVRGDVWTMRGGTDSAEWYVAALERALGVVPAGAFPAGLDTKAAIARAREPDFAILS